MDEERTKARTEGARTPPAAGAGLPAAGRSGRYLWVLGALLCVGLLLAGLANHEWGRVLSNGRLL